MQAPRQVQRGSGEASGEGSGEGLGGFGVEPGQVQQGSGEASGEASGEGSGEGQALVQSQVRFNRVLEKLPEKVPILRQYILDIIGTNRNKSKRLGSIGSIGDDDYLRSQLLCLGHFIRQTILVFLRFGGGWRIRGTAGAGFGSSDLLKQTWRS